MLDQYDAFYMEMHHWAEENLNLGKEGLSKIRNVTDRSALEGLIVEVEDGNSRRAPGSKFSRSIEKACSRLHEFLECFAGIADIAKGCHNQGGSIAYGLLSVILMVIRNKRDRRSMIASYLEGAKDHLKDLEFWEGVYEAKADTPLSNAIIAVYREIFRFTTATWESFNTTRIRRVFQALRPVKYSIQVNLDLLVVAVKKLDKETNKMLHVRFKEQEERANELEEQETRYKNMETELEWKGLRTRLRCPDSTDCSTRLEFLKQEAQAYLEDEEETYSTLEIGDIRVITDQQAYQKWWRGTNSNILLIWGVNHNDSDSSNSLWLSAGFTELAQILRQRNSQSIFQVIHNIGQSPQSILSLIACELLGWDWDFFAANKDIFPELGVDCTSTDFLIGFLTTVLSRWSDSHPDQYVYILLEGFNIWVRSRSDLVSGAWLKVWNALLDCAARSKIIKICFLMQRDSWSQQIKDVMDLSCSTNGMDDKIWDTGCLRQGNKVT